MGRRAFDFASYVLGLAFNAGILVLTLSLVISYTVKFFDSGKDFGAKLTAPKASKEVEITLEDGATIDEVADILYEKGVIVSPWIFRIENILKNNDESFKGGTFVVNANMDSNQLNYALRKTESIKMEEVRVTIVEGYTMKDIGDLLESEGLVSSEEFLTACNEMDFNYTFLRDLPERENRLEGYLFPDTYFFAKQSTAEEIIVRLLDRFDEIFKWEYYARAKELGLSVDEVVTIASIIEKEISRAEERELASAVVYNRLDRNEALGMCSTILYALDKRKDRLLDEDLQVDSPYNTYTNAGLPIGPISNPGEACIEAALYPANVNYLWFVVKDEETGEHFFTNDYDKFLNAKVQYKQKY